MIEVQGLTKRYGAVQAVDDLTFTVKPGIVTGFLGPNGAGKSTTMRMILGLDKPTSGTALIDARPYTSWSNPAQKVGALLDAKGVHPNRSARATLLWQAQAAGLNAARVDEVLSLVGLSDVAGKNVGGFSLGMNQRLGIAAALLGDPEYLILDEPVNGLDPEGIRWVRGLLRALAAEGRTVLVSSHMLAEMAQTADHLIVIGRGKLVADTSVAEFIKANSSVSTQVRAGVDTQALFSALTEAFGADAVTRGADPEGREVVTVSGRASDEVGAAAFAAGVQLAELAERRASLEEAYIQSTEGHAQYVSGAAPAAPASAPAPARAPEVPNA
ncbi:ABC transporter ATP-binding protein [Corynebacterium sp. TA-R-1]|uniref:ABC transporter ATP-binding protein n=1 Tax=Corynebacterium stercoris TaxID=2943490 RepID=A0ABT1G0T8_9CORY|nr:ABC transporter ATP-binding protein [Corynebacterium stercoris]MCP1387631.1 ABC transporter ATP-binding protein [Corynebacterium stercoris]